MALTTMLPWQAAHVEEARRELGEDWWPLRPRAQPFACSKLSWRYHHEQGLSKRRLEAEELFAPEDARDLPRVIAARSMAGSRGNPCFTGSRATLQPAFPCQNLAWARPPHGMSLAPPRALEPIS